MIRSRTFFKLFALTILLSISIGKADTWNTFVSAGAFKIKKNAVQLQKKLQENWIGPPIVLKKKGRLHVVFIGPFRSTLEAEQCQIKLDTMGYPAVILRR